MLEDVDGKIGADGHDNQWNEKLIATCQFCNEENTRQRCMHHCCHHCCHTIKSKVLLRNIHTELLHIPETGKEETTKATDKQ